MAMQPIGDYSGDTYGITVSWGRTGTVRILDGNGDTLAKAGGYGYDKAGAALGSFVNTHFQPELLRLHRIDQQIQGESLMNR